MKFYWQRWNKQNQKGLTRLYTLIQLGIMVTVQALRSGCGIAKREFLYVETIRCMPIQRILLN